MTETRSDNGDDPGLHERVYSELHGDRYQPDADDPILLESARDKMAGTTTIFDPDHAGTQWLEIDSDHAHDQWGQR